MEERKIIKKYASATRSKSFIIRLDLEGFKGRYDYPEVEICVNDKSLYKEIVEGKQTVDIRVDDLSVEHELSIELLYKDLLDTVLEGDEIVADKSLKFHKIYIDEVNIRKYVYQGKQIPIYHHEGQGPSEMIGNHLFFPGKWKLKYENPPRQYFAGWNGSLQKINSPEKVKTKNFYLDQLRNLMSK